MCAGEARPTGDGEQLMRSVVEPRNKVNKLLPNSPGAQHAASHCQGRDERSRRERQHGLCVQVLMNRKIQRLEYGGWERLRLTVHLHRCHRYRSPVGFFFMAYKRDTATAGFLCLKAELLEFPFIPHCQPSRWIMNCLWICCFRHANFCYNSPFLFVRKLGCIS